MILGCSSQEAVGPTTTTLSHTVYDHHLRYFGWGYPHVSNWLSNMGPWLFFLMEVIESFLWLEHHASGTKSLCCNSHCDWSMMGVSNTSREVTQCSSVSTAVNNRRSAAERNFFDMFISKRFIPSCYIQTYSVYFLPLGSYTQVREGLHALLMGTANRFGWLHVAAHIKSRTAGQWQELLLHTSELWSNPNPNLCPTPSLWMLILVMALFFPGLTVVEYIPNFSDESSTALAHTSS